MKFVKCEGLAQVVVGTCIEPTDHVARVNPRGKKKDWCTNASPPNVAQDQQSVPMRKT